MNKKFIMATGNSHKVKEISLYLEVEKAPFCIDLPTQKLTVLEDGGTFQENAFLKAKAYFDYFKTPSLADDSGLVVAALPDELGVHTARFGGDNLSDKQRCELLLERIKGIKKEERSAYFICLLCFYLSEHEVLFFEGRLEGNISTTFSGSNGFGYDPIFCPQKSKSLNMYLKTQNLNYHQITLADIENWKQLNSHRAKALSGGVRYFKSSCQS